MIGILLRGGIVYAASYKASDVSYSNDKTTEENVHGALDELYENLGIKELELLKEGSVSSNITTSN